MKVKIASFNFDDFGFLTSSEPESNRSVQLSSIVLFSENVSSIYK